MEKPFKFRRANEIAGAFVLLALVLLTSGILVSGHVQGWFKPQRTFQIVLPDQGSLGIRKGTEVQIMGTRAGAVRDVVLMHKGSRSFKIHDVPPNEIRMVAILDLRSELIAFVGKESQAQLKYDLAGFGAPFLEITRGFTPRTEEENMIAFVKSEKQDINQAVEEISLALVPAIKTIQQLADSMGNPESEFQQTVAGVNQVLKDMNAGRGPAGMFLKDEAAAENFRQSLVSFEAAMENLTEATDGLETVTQRLPTTLNLSDTAIREMTQTAIDLQVAAEEYEILAEGLQEHWFLRRSVDKVEKAREESATKQSQDLIPVSSASAEKQTKSGATTSRDDDNRPRFSPRKATGRH